jgi:hypothetical protein
MTTNRDWDYLSDEEIDGLMELMGDKWLTDLVAMRRFHLGASGDEVVGLLQILLGLSEALGVPKNGAHEPRGVAPLLTQERAHLVQLLGAQPGILLGRDTGIARARRRSHLRQLQVRRLLQLRQLALGPEQHVDGLGELWAAQKFLADVSSEGKLCGFNNADDGLLSWSAGIRNGSASWFIDHIRPFVNDALAAGSDGMPPGSARVIVLEEAEGRGIVLHQIGPTGEREAIRAVEASWDAW